jgi:class 3 adenylate cyclase
MDYTAQGHTVGLAQRMEALAEAGKIYLTTATAQRIKGIASACGWRGSSGSRARSAVPTPGTDSMSRVSTIIGSIDIQSGDCDMDHDLHAGP